MQLISYIHNVVQFATDFIIYTTDQTTLCICNEYLIYTTLCSMQQVYYIHNVVQMQLISYIHNVGRTCFRGRVVNALGRHVQ